MSRNQTVAYFSMEIGLDEKIHTYSGGLGVLAGDTIRAAADLKVPMVAVTLLYRKGYFTQRLEADGWQREEPASWAPEEHLKEMPQRTSVTIEGRTVNLRCWRYDATGVDGFIVPVYFLDAQLEENAENDRSLTDFLYGGFDHYRLSQEIILGIGGVRMLREICYNNLHSFHMNEGHAALLTMELLDETARRDGRTTILPEDKAVVRQQCVFTTHTPVPAGHDKFPAELAVKLIGNRPDFFDMDGVLENAGTLNMTYLALNLSRYINGVAQKHGEVSRLMFTGHSINSITNGIHGVSWVSQPFATLFDKYIPSWRKDNMSLRAAIGIPKQEIWEAHMQAKRQLLDYVNRNTGTRMDENVFTIGFARRATEYKRGALLFSDIERLRWISRQFGKIQIVYAGKAHPRDHNGKEIIKRIFAAREYLAGDVEIAFLENYNMQQGAMLTAGVDVWLNTPEAPLEASGTSGMKAAINGVPSLSILDGWWIEGHIEGQTGWSVGEPHTADYIRNDWQDADSLYNKLKEAVLPTYYWSKEQYVQVMKNSIASNGAYFNTHRMMQEYVLNAYFASRTSVIQEPVRERELI
ncbi:MAG: alpha-glucan family phosphorylase [Bacteroidota bacterium]